MTTLTAVFPAVPFEVFAGEGFQLDFMLSESARDASVESKSFVISGLAGAAAGAPPAPAPGC